MTESVESEKKVKHLSRRFLSTELWARICVDTRALCLFAIALLPLSIPGGNH